MLLFLSDVKVWVIVVAVVGGILGGIVLLAGVAGVVALLQWKYPHGSQCQDKKEVIVVFIIICTIDDAVLLL